MNSVLSEEVDINNIGIKCLTPDEVIESLDEIAEPLAKVASEGFGRVVTVEKMKERLIEEPNVILAEDQNGIIGFQLQSVIDSEINERYVYYSRSITREYQGAGLARRLMHTAVNLYQPDVIGAKSQNPAAIISFMRAMQDLGISDIYPLVDADKRQILLPHLLQMSIIAKVHDTTDFSNGICRNAYGSRLGDYEIRLGNPDVVRIEEYLALHKFDRNAGDSLFYFAVIPKVS